MKHEMSKGTSNGSDTEWTLDISDEPKHFIHSIKNLHGYRYLLALFVYRDLVTTYKQTILGPAWIVLQPLLTTLAFVAAFSGIMGISTANIPPMLFYMSGIICWSLFSEVFTKTSTTFVDNASIFSKVYFPRLIRPLSLVLSSFLRVAIQLTVLAVTLLYYINAGSVEMPGLSVISIFPVLGVIALFGLAFGLLFSSVTAKYRDLRYLINFGIQLLMFVTPVIYPLSQVPEQHQIWMYINPLTAPIESFRSVVLGTEFPSIGMVMYSVIGVSAAAFAGVIAFHKVEARAMDTV